MNNNEDIREVSWYSGYIMELDGKQFGVWENGSVYPYNIPVESKEWQTFNDKLQEILRVNSTHIPHRSSIAYGLKDMFELYTNATEVKFVLGKDDELRRKLADMLPFDGDLNAII